MSFDKQIVREKFRRLRDQQSREDKQLADRAIAINLASLIKDFAPKTVMAYQPLKSEADPLANEVSKYLYPRVAGEQLKAFRVPANHNFSKSAFGVMEPAESAEHVPPHEIEMVLVPAIAFDRQGRRLGFGKGYYDRFLKTTAATRVGVAYSFQVSTDELPSEEWDERMEWIVTDRYILRVEGKGLKQWKS